MIGKIDIKAYLPLLLALLAPIWVLAQAPKFQAVTNKTTVGEGERFKVEYRFNSSGDEFTPPKFGGFRILSGPNQSTSMQFVNGRSAYSISYSYVLMALKEGEFEIPPAKIRSGSESFESNTINIKVVKGQSPNQSNQKNNQQQQQQQQQQPSSKGGDENVFIKAFVSKSSPYVGEQMIVTYKLYFNYNIVDNSFTTLPSLNGFWSEDIDMKNTGGQTEVFGNVRYNVATLKKAVLIPQRAGDLTIDPLEMDLIIQKPQQARSRSLFDQFFGNYKNVKISVKSDPVKINVKALPSGKPSSFDGAVGSFSMDLKADRTDLPQNESVNLSYTISGKGNLKLLNEPAIDFPSDFEVYDPETRDNIAVSGGGMTGSRSYNYLIIPRHKGEYSVPAVAFTYFDPSKQQYVTLNSNDLTFNISKGSDDDAGVITYSGSNKEEVKLLGSDIRFIKPTTTLVQIGYNFFGSWLHYLLWIFPAPIFLLSMFAKRKYMERMSDEVYMKKSRASKMAVKRLSNAKKHLNDADEKAFYEEVFKAMYGFFGDKFNINTADINKDRIQEVMNGSGIASDLAKEALSVIDMCEMARFAPVSNVSTQEVYDKAVKILSDLQKNIK